MTGRTPGANAQLRLGPSKAPSIAGSTTAEVLRRLELTVTRRLDGMLQGDYRGLVPGHGSELGETREYTPGDDVRRMDWNVTARLLTPHVRETIADRELETWIAVDLSGSTAFGTAECEKRDLALAAAGAVGLLTSKTGNRIGALLLAGGEPTTVPARSGRTNLMALLATVVAEARNEHAGPTDLSAGIARLHSTMRRRGLAVVISDFLDGGSWDGPLRALSSRHEVLAIELIDPRELELPDIGLVTLRDPETGAHFEIQTADAKVRTRFARAAADQREAIARRMRAAGADHLILRTDSDWLIDLVRFVAMRRERIEAIGRATGARTSGADPARARRGAVGVTR